MADRGGGVRAVLSWAVRDLYFFRAGKQVLAGGAGRGLSLGHFFRGGAGARDDYERIRAADGECGAAAAVEFWLYAIAPDAGESGGNTGGGENISPKEIAV